MPKNASLFHQSLLSQLRGSSWGFLVYRPDYIELEGELYHAPSKYVSQLALVIEFMLGSVSLCSPWRVNFLPHFSHYFWDGEFYIVHVVHISIIYFDHQKVCMEH